MNDLVQGDRPWWGVCPIQKGHGVSWSVGERSIVLFRQAAEWQCWDVQTEAESDEPLVTRTFEAYPDLSIDHLTRYLVGQTQSPIKVFPALADRSIVARPNAPLHLLQGQRAKLYVSTPLWFKVFLLPDELLLVDIPFWRPSDSWFGESNISGELSYAKFTEARTDMSQYQFHSCRALTPIELINLGDDSLQIERLNVPVPLLGVYADGQNNLWTDKLTITRESDGDTAEVQLSHGAPGEASGANKISEPRVVMGKRIIARALSTIFA